MIYSHAQLYEKCCCGFNDAKPVIQNYFNHILKMLCVCVFWKRFIIEVKIIKHFNYFFSSNKMENTENTQVITQIIFEESEKATI